MTRKNCFCGLTVGATLLLSFALVVVVAIGVQALYVRQVGLERQAKGGQATRAEFAELRASHRETLEGGFEVLEQDASNAPVRVRLPIGIAMEGALKTAQTTARRSAR